MLSVCVFVCVREGLGGGNLPFIKTKKNKKTKKVHEVVYFQIKAALSLKVFPSALLI